MLSRKRPGVNGSVLLAASMPDNARTIRTTCKVNAIRACRVTRASNPARSYGAPLPAKLAKLANRHSAR
ncbi:MAG TPA: hypothetical protein VE988_08630, partial [Gemmataceae bacterium]|nr:hypothetical protein [Gemmataceae bacterium]